VPISEILATDQEAQGRIFGDILIWPDMAYFDSARGDTLVRLQARLEDSGESAWEEILAGSVMVVPSKIGEEAYLRMAQDLKNLNRSLLLDLYGKSKRSRDLRYGKLGEAHHSMEEELTAIHSALDRLDLVLPAIQRRPASRLIRQKSVFPYWGTEKLSSDGIRWASNRGVDLSRSPRPVMVLDNRAEETFDVPEHRLIRAFLEALGRRAQVCARAARNDIRSILIDRPFRDHHIAGHPSLFETNDLPRLNRLKQALKTAEMATRLSVSLANLPFLRNVPPSLGQVRGGMFLRSPEYIEVLKLYREFVGTRTLWDDGEGSTAITKLTWRIFEQWCFLWIVESFRNEGLELEGWEGTLRQHLKSRFLLDFNRGLFFTCRLEKDLLLRIRYEPWIFGRATALMKGETLCRGLHTDVPWSPDIVIECQRVGANPLETTYSIVLDCKYKGRLRESDWDRTAKYLEIRGTTSARQVVKQLWLVAPGGNNQIDSRDPMIVFDLGGVSCRPDEAVSMAMQVRIEAGSHEGTHVPKIFQDFASGTLAYLRRHLA
jgi:hypothetical protein